MCAYVCSFQGELCETSVKHALLVEWMLYIYFTRFDLETISHCNALILTNFVAGDKSKTRLTSQCPLIEIITMRSCKARWV